MTEMITDTTTEDLTVLFPYEEADDPETKTHIINQEMNKHVPVPMGLVNEARTQAIVDIARALGLEITALCGYTWVPVHNPEMFDVCPACIEISGSLIKEFG